MLLKPNNNNNDDDDDDDDDDNNNNSSNNNNITTMMMMSFRILIKFSKILRFFKTGQQTFSHVSDIWFIVSFFSRSTFFRHLLQ